ncbi:5-methylcytosine-specific restriction protein B [Methylobacterium sp. OAE515]|uniref:McrB family protein n=1 Tax=Methylobacterium sp. OAE515 TaxID=2817895 RepID=UPI00178B4730
MQLAKIKEVKASYNDAFLPNHDPGWEASCLTDFAKISSVTEQEFRTPEFQRFLWELDDIASIGPGNSVTVPGAYQDVEIVEVLWQLKQWIPSQDVISRASHLDAEYNRLIGLVSPRHNLRRPWARLARLFWGLRPEEMLCLVDSVRTNKFRVWLEQPTQGLGFIGQHVISRQALREALGPEASPTDHVLYSQFSWHVWKQLNPKQPEAITKPEVVGTKVTDTPQLAILPAKVQRKGISYVSNNLALLLSIVRGAENGNDRESLLHQIADEVPTLSSASRVNVLSQAPSLGLLSVEGGTYRPTAAGKALLEGEPPADVLTPIMVRTVFGFAHILDDLGYAGTLTRLETSQKCRSYYPRWTTDFAPNQLITWMRDLGLVEIKGVGKQALIKLTESGEYWRSGLPNEIKIPSLLLSNELPDEKALEEVAQEEATSLVPDFVTPSVDAILTRFHQDDRLKTLVFTDAQIRMLHAALHSAQGKRFVLLAGLSGTGKTSIARGYAQAYCEARSLEMKAHYAQVAVWPDWTDPTGLLGFVNPLANPPTFQETPALQLLLAAHTNPDKPYFLCLDEMNLARVEHYFAPFLSAMEGGNGRLTIHANRDAVDAIPSSIAWPGNLFVMGTVNMDETTYPFSDKVLDRAFTFEFWDVDLERWSQVAAARENAKTAVDLLQPVLKQLAEALKPARRHFGYRTCDEVLGFVMAYPEAEHEIALDAAILAKVLPKVRGDSGGELPKAIDKALEVTKAANLMRCTDKLTQMRATLQEMGAVRFWY